MSILAGKGYYRFCQALGVILLPVSIAALFFLTIEEKVRARGVVESSTQIVVTAKVKDTVIKRVCKSVGDPVRKGELVVEFDDLHGFRNEAERTRVALSALEDRYSRLKPLHEAGSVPEKDLKKIQYDIDALKVALRDFEEKAERLLATSPLDGRVVNVFVEPYQQAEIGKELFAVSAEDAKVIRCAIPERHYALIRPGQRVDIKSELYNYLKYDLYRGQVAEVSPYGYLEQENVFYDVVLQITKGGAELRVGSAAECEIITGRAPLIRLLFPEE